MGQKEKNANTKAFFFLRHNNDIDHITPVLYKWLSTKKVHTDIIIISNKKFLNDYRINYLKKYDNVKIYLLSDHFNKFSLLYVFNSLYFKYTTEFDALIKKYSIIKKLAKRTFTKVAKKIFKDADNGIIVFDWITTFFVQHMVNFGKKNGFVTLSLPHGDRVYISQIDKLNDINYDTLKIYKPADIFDYVVVPNKMCSLRYVDFLDENKIKILGSPRYSDKWLNIINKLIPKYELVQSDDKLKIVFFIRNTGFPIFWEEVIRAIQLIVQFPEVYLIVKHHPRNKIAKKLTKKLLNHNPQVAKSIDVNLKFIYEDVNSVSLIKWADVIIDLGTSVAWEPIKQKKPVLMLEYVNANYAIISHYMEESEINCRDELYEVLKKFIKDKNKPFYNEASRRKFIKDIIDVSDKNTLDVYCDFLKKCLNESKNK